MTRSRRIARALVVGFGAWLIGACTPSHTHGSVTGLSMASNKEWKACEHDVPEDVCVQCQPARAAKFKARGDWCDEHDVPESQCLACHADLDFSPPEKPPEGADVVHLVERGEDLPALEPHLVSGKATVFDFYATWCTPCRKVDGLLYATLRRRSDIAVRKINVGSWDTPVAQRWLTEVPELPYVVVYAKDGHAVARISGAKLEEIDAALAEAAK